MAFATSAVRDANNSEAVLSRVRAETGVNLEVLSGVDEARLTFLAVRRWYGWSAGRILNLDIGGGSLELTCGGDEDPDVAFLAATRRRPAHPGLAPGGSPGKRRVAVLRDWLDAELATPRRSCAPRAPRTCASHLQDLPIPRPPHRRSAFRCRSARQAHPHRERAAAADRVHLTDDDGGPCRIGGRELRPFPADRRRGSRCGGQHARAGDRHSRDLPVGTA
ncbi:hypothetical protein GS580_27625 [Rhodococcus hoagii]|nr:hypothetical protein [Prescottella equi]